MTDEQLDLARRLVACPGFRRLGGMLGLWQQDTEDPWPERMEYADSAPYGCRLVAVDLDDPATIGCLEHLARKAWEALDVPPMRHELTIYSDGSIGVEQVVREDWRVTSTFIEIPGPDGWPQQLLAACSRGVPRPETTTTSTEEERQE